MATTSVVLDIRANTTRALNEFKKFSSQLDNKFLVSGLKLDVVRSALGQINREFQKAIGEQGLQAGQSLRAAENQAALLLGTFKGVGEEASLAITTQFSEAFNKIAVNAGATSKDVQKALAATPFISTNLSEDVRKQIGEGIIKSQVDAKRAGFGEKYGDIIAQFLAGEVDAGDLANSTDALRSRIGVELSNLGGTRGRLMSAEQRSNIVNQLQSGKFGRELSQLAERADWGLSIIQKLNAYLFNPKEGVFGSLRQVTMSIGDKTTVFDETRALIDSVFGRQGFFVNFFKQIAKIFGIEDPLKVVINGIRWLTRQFEKLTKFLESPMVQQAVDLAQKVISGVVSFFTDLYNRVSGYLQSEEGQQLTTRVTTFFTDLFKSIGEFYKSEQGQQIRAYAQRAVDNVKNLFKAIDDTVKAGDWDPSRIQAAIEQIGTDVRSFIRNVGKSFRELDIKQQGNFVLEIIGTLVEEIARTIGAVISEGIKSIFSERGLSVLVGLIGVVNKALTGFFSEIFGEGAGGIFGGIATAGLAAIFGKKITLAIIAFGAKIIAALPGVGLVTRIFSGATRGLVRLGRNLTSGVLRLVGLSAIAERVRVPLAAGRGTDGAAASVLGLGSTQTFQRQVVFYLARIAGCVCVPGFGRGGGLGGGGRAGNRGPTVTGGATLPSGPPPSKFPQDGPAVLRSRDRIMRRPIAPLSAQLPMDAALDPYSRARRGIGGRALGFGRDLVLTGADSPVPGYLDRSRGNVAARFNRRYGSRGTRAVLGRGLSGRLRGVPEGLRGIGRGLGGKSALAGLALTAVGVGGLSLLGERPANADGMPEELRQELDTFKAQQEMEREELIQMGGSNAEVKSLQSQQSAEMAQLREQLQEESQQQKKEEGREGTRGWLGLGTSLAGGWAGGKAGAGIGAMVGGPWGAAIGGVVGGLAGATLGEEAVKLLSDEILDSINNVAGNVGNFFTKTIPDGWNSALSSTMNWISSTSSSVSNFFTKTIPDGWNSAFSSTKNWISNTSSSVSNFFTKTIPDGWNSAFSSTKNWISSTSSSVSNFFTKTIPDGWNSALSAIGSWIGTTKTTIVNFFTQTIPNLFSRGLRTLVVDIPKALGDFGRKLAGSLIDAVTKFNLGEAIMGALQRLGGGEGNFAGLNFMGPTLAQESRNSGSRALVVNEDEFVIPTNGFSTLTNLVEQRLLSNGKGSSSSSQVSANFNVTIQVNGGLNAGNVESLRGPVLAIIQDAWKEASTGITSRGAII